MENMILDNLKRIAKALSVQFGEHCEIVIHDLTGNAIEHSIVHIENGDVSGRSVGDGPSQLVLDTFAKKTDSDLPDHLAYLLHTNNGRILKSSTIFIRNAEGKICYIFAINYDITNLQTFSKALSSFVACNDGDEHSPRPLTGDVNNLLDELIDRSVELVGVPVRAMTKEDKIKAIQFLNDAGAFLITKSGDKVAKYFGISKYTLYSYVDINK